MVSQNCPAVLSKSASAIMQKAVFYIINSIGGLSKLLSGFSSHPLEKHWWYPLKLTWDIVSPKLVPLAMRKDTVKFCNLKNEA